MRARQELQTGWRTWAMAVGVACLWLLAGCGDEASGDGAVALPASYTGEAEGSDFFVAVSRGPDDELLAYACDGVATGHWFRGELAGEEASLESATGAALELVLDGDAVTGTLLVDGESHEFTAQRAEDSQGFLRGEAHDDAGTQLVAGWIQLPDGRQKGLLSATSGRTTSEPTVVPIARLSEPSPDQIDDLGEEEELQMLEGSDPRRLELPGGGFSAGLSPGPPDVDECAVFGVCPPPDAFTDMVRWTQMCLDGVDTPPPDFPQSSFSPSWEAFCAGVT